MPALLHAEKCKLLCELRVGSVRHEDILRLRAHDDNLGFALVICGMETFMDESAIWRAVHNNDFDTDKHRMLWMISTSVLEHRSSRKCA